MITILSSKTDVIGGYDYTVRLGEYLRQKSASSSGSRRAFWREYSNWEAVKIALSSSSADNYFWLGSEEFATEPDFEISREVIEVEWKQLLDSFSNFVNSFLELCKNNFKISEISKCRLCGGGMQLWCLQQRVQSAFEQYSRIEIS